MPHKTRSESPEPDAPLPAGIAWVFDMLSEGVPILPPEPGSGGTPVGSLTLTLLLVGLLLATALLFCLS
ncbi:MAG: hypothetical protein HGA65_09125 [Oscillochloris sp.]|nr:hypothetical protein [Oscillochloris sp.]